MSDESFMKHALVLAQEARLIAPPNPWVGCVLVKEKIIVGRGSTQPPGGDHAEVVALKQAGDKAHGSTAYVTLEPCSHFGRTPPCTDALIKAKVKRCVVGIEDPDSQVSGSGLQVLREAGIEVSIGCLNTEIQECLTPYLFHRKTGRPYVVAKAALSIDGKMAAADGSSQWISCPEARADGHRLRAHSQAIIVGSGTALHDHPKLTVRGIEVPNQPLRVIFDRRGRVEDEQAWITNSSPREALLELGKRGVLQVLMEGGPTLLSSFLKEGLINELVLYLGPKILGKEGLTPFKDVPISSIDEAIGLKLLSQEIFGDTVKIRYTIS